VPAGMFAEDQLERLRTFPDIGQDDLIRYFTLTPADVAFLDPGRGRGPADRLGLAVALATLPWPGTPIATAKGKVRGRREPVELSPPAGA
jgi:hypothetical protein